MSELVGDNSDEGVLDGDGPTRPVSRGRRNRPSRPRGVATDVAADRGVGTTDAEPLRSEGPADLDLAAGEAPTADEGGAPLDSERASGDESTSPPVMDEAEPAAVATAADGAGAEHTNRRRSRKGARRRPAAVAALVIAGLVALALVGEVLNRRRSDTVTGPVVLPAAATVADDFERPSSRDGLGDATPGGRWQEVLGGWDIDRGDAYLRSPNSGGLLNTALVDLGSADGSVEAVVAGAAVCGVIVRYADPNNFVVLKRVPLFGVWNLEQVRKGVSSRLTFAADSNTPTVTVRLDFRDDDYTVYIGAASVTARGGGRTGGTSIGLYAEGTDARNCRWGSVRGWRAEEGQ